MNVEPKSWGATEVHDWEGKERSVLVLNYTMQCALACDFCCYGCNPHRREKMPLELARRLICEASQLPQFSSIAFTGGEPLLYRDEIAELGSQMRSLGLTYTIATACHWAESYRVARDLLEILRESGLIRLNVSHDQSHEKFVPKKYVLNAARAANDLKIPTHIVGTFASSDQSLSALMPEASDLTYVRLHTKYVAKVGMAKNWNISQARYGLKLAKEDLCCYRRIHHDIVIWHDGTVYPCCSTFNRATPGISVGNVNQDSLQEIWNRVDGSLMLRIMKRQGFGDLYQLIEKMDKDLFDLLPDASRTVGPCGLCNAIFKDPKIYDRVRKAFEAYEIEKSTRAVEMIADLLGEDVVVSAFESFLMSNENEGERHV